MNIGVHGGSSQDPRPTRRLPSPGGPASGSGAALQCDSLPHIVQPAAASQRGPAVDTPPEKRHQGEKNGSTQGERGRRRQQAVAVTPAAAAAAVAGSTVGVDERMNPADLAAKKMLLPFINELSFIEIALEEVRWLPNLVG